MHDATIVEGKQEIANSPQLKMERKPPDAVNRYPGSAAAHEKTANDGRSGAVSSTGRDGSVAIKQEAVEDQEGAGRSGGGDVHTANDQASRDSTTEGATVTDKSHPPSSKVASTSGTTEKKAPKKKEPQEYRPGFSPEECERLRTLVAEHGKKWCVHCQSDVVARGKHAQQRLVFVPTTCDSVRFVDV